MNKLLAFVAAVAALAVIAAGCGDSSDGGSTSAGATEGQTSSQTPDAGGVVKEAEENLAKLVEEPPKIDIPPLEKAPPTGTELSFLGCPVPTCIATEVGAQEAADVLGWSMKGINQGLTPPTVQSAFNALLQDPGEAIAVDGVLPNSVTESQMKQLSADGIPLVGLARSDPPDDLMQATTAAPNQMRGDGEAMANWVIIDSEGDPGDVIYAYDPAIPGLLGAQEAFHETMEELSPETTVTDLKVATVDSGTKMPAAIVNAVRTSPDAEYVAFNIGDYATGVPQAIKAANLSSEPTLLTRAATTTNMEQVQNGEMATALTAETIESGWRAVDLLIRLLNDEKLYSTTPVGGRTFLTTENLPEDISVPFAIPDFQKYFEEAWGK